MEDMTLKGEREMTKEKPVLTNGQKVGKLLVNVSILVGVWGFMEVAMKGQRVGWEMLAIYIAIAAVAAAIGGGLLRTRYAFWGVAGTLAPIVSVVIDTVMK